MGEMGCGGEQKGFFKLPPATAFGDS